MTLIDQINDLVGDRLTADKAACIAERDGYKVTGVVMTRIAQEGDDFTGVQRCIVNLGGVRWFNDAQRWHDEIMFPEGRPKLAEVIAQRDELLAACEGVIAWDKRRQFVIPYKVRDPIHAAIAAAKEKKSGECKHCNGKGVSQISDPCICQFGQKGGAA